MYQSSHAGWEFLSMLLFGAAWFVGMMYLQVATEEARSGKVIPPPAWLNSLSTSFVFSSCLGSGVVVIAERITLYGPSFFLLVYLFVLTLLLAPVWLNPELGELKKLTWRKSLFLVSYAIFISYVTIIGVKKDGPISFPYLLFIPFALVTLFLLVIGLVQKKRRAEAMKAAGILAAFGIWLAFLAWLSRWIT